MRKLALVLLIIANSSGLLFDDFAHAQGAGSETGQTPREYVLRDLGLDGVNTQTTSEIVTPPSPKQQAPKKQANVPLAPFYLSAQDYLKLRNSKIQALAVLHYDVRRGPVSGFNLMSAFDKVQKVQIILGKDFAAIKIDENLKIYDFELNRLLTVKPGNGADDPQSDAPVFDNISLYAKAYRNMNTVKRVTQGGSLKALPMGAGKSLDAFWVESSMSWAAGAPDTALDINAEKQPLVGTRKDQLIFKASFSDEIYGLEDFRDTFLAFAHHELPLHPQILQALYTYNAPPKRLEILTYSPTALEGQKQTWVLTEQIGKEAAFPLDEKALGVAQRQGVSPLAQIIKEAAHNRALGGMQSPADIEADFEDAYKKEDMMALWLAGQKYNSYTGQCAKKDTWLCASLRDIAKNNERISPEDKKLTDYIAAVSLAKNKDTRARALEMLKPYLDDPEVPAIILRTAAMARARMKPGQAKAASLGDIDAEALLKAALAKDPYDPKTYIGLAQVLAAKGAYEQSWDIYDALRAGIPTAQGVELKINRVERNLRKSTPGYFLDP